MLTKPRRFSLRVHISILFTLLVFVSCGVVSFIYYKKNVEMTASQADALLSGLIVEIIREMDELSNEPTIAVNLVGHHQLIQANSLETRLQSISFLSEALLSSDELTSIFVGYPDGEFFLLRKLWDERDKKLFHVPDNAVWVLQSIEHIKETNQFLSNYLFF